MTKVDKKAILAYSDIADFVTNFGITQFSESEKELIYKLRNILYKRIGSIEDEWKRKRDLC